MIGSGAVVCQSPAVNQLRQFHIYIAIGLRYIFTSWKKLLHNEKHENERQSTTRDRNSFIMKMNSCTKIQDPGGWTGGYIVTATNQ
jgi:hypothetical protein